LFCQRIIYPPFTETGFVAATLVKVHLPELALSYTNTFFTSTVNAGLANHRQDNLATGDCLYVIVAPDVILLVAPDVYVVDCE
jgi:hypothetical protein